MQGERDRVAYTVTDPHSQLPPREISQGPRVENRFFGGWTTIKQGRCLASRLAASMDYWFDFVVVSSPRTSITPGVNWVTQH